MMLQRASHIRTKQCKWLEQSLQDMDEKVHGMIKLIEEAGDSFAKRAEMIKAVEDSYLAFKLLAERYDILSKKIQNTNDADDDYPMPAPTKSTKASMDSLKGFIKKIFSKTSSEDIACPEPREDSQPQHKISRSHHVPMTSFIFGSATKVKKKKSLFNFMHAN